MKHIRIRYSIDKLPIPEEHPADCRWAVVDHQTGATIERWLTWGEAHDLIDELNGIDTRPDMPVEYPAHDRAASAADAEYDRNREGW